MDQRDDYDDQRGQRRDSPLLTLVLLVAIVVASCIISHLLLMARDYILGTVPPR